MKILAIESSAKQASCAFVEDGNILMEAFINVNLTHSGTLMPMLEAMLSACRLSVKDTELFAVSNGPGSFTGVRIGISAAKGMAAALHKPLMGISTLETMAENLRLPFDYLICAAMDARRNQVYNAVYESHAGNISCLYGDRALAVDDLLKELYAFDPLPIFLVGDGARLCYNRVKGGFSALHIAPEPLRYARASGVALAAERLYDANAVYDPAELKPNYLRLPQAEREKRSLDK